MSRPKIGSATAGEPTGAYGTRWMKSWIVSHWLATEPATPSAMRTARIVRPIRAIGPKSGMSSRPRPAPPALYGGRPMGLPGLDGPSARSL